MPGPQQMWEDKSKILREEDEEEEENEELRK